MAVVLLDGGCEEEEGDTLGAVCDKSWTLFEGEVGIRDRLAGEVSDCLTVLSSELVLLLKCPPDDGLSAFSSCFDAPKGSDEGEGIDLRGPGEAAEASLVFCCCR